MSELRTPLSKVKGLGSAKEGTGHFWHQRLTAIALIPLMLWLCFSLASLPAMSHDSILAWLSSPLSAVLMILALISIFLHAALGLQVVIEDYVGNRAVKTAAIIAVKFVCVILAVSGIFAVLKIAFGS